jgi:hypothetical protein
MKLARASRPARSASASFGLFKDKDFKRARSPPAMANKGELSAAGEPFRLKVRRDADGTSGTDDIATDAELVRIVIREP